jgi:hypothetical protein
MAMNMNPVYNNSLEPYTNDTVLMSGFLIFPSETTQLHLTEMEYSSMLRHYATGTYFLYHVQLKNYTLTKWDVVATYWRVS